MSPASYSRWCPTPEQLMILKELYNSGVRTPNASQIQRITSYLSLYGKIQGKSVFYWFQNHKAREKKKLRNKLIKQLQLQQKKLQVVQCPNDIDHSHPLSLPASSDLSFHLMSYHSTSPSFPYEGGLEGAHTTTQVMDPTIFKVEIPPRIMENTNKMMRPMCEYNWMTVMAEDVGPHHHTCCTINTSTSTRPLKTLELFPLTSTNLKEECNSSTSPN